MLSVTLSSLLKTRSVVEALDVDDGDDALDAAVERFMKLFNGDWRSGRPEHYCCGASDRIPCHANLQTARDDMAGAVVDINVTLIWRKCAEDSKKWCEVTRRSALYSFTAMCHNLMAKGAQAWLPKAFRSARDDGVVVASQSGGRGRGGRGRGSGRGQDSGDASGAVDDRHKSPSPERADDDHYKRRKKRQLRSGSFWTRKGSKAKVLAVAIATAAQRTLLGDIFKVERAAGILAAGGEAAQQWHAKDKERNEAESPFSLGGRLVRDGGSLDRAAQTVEELITAPSSPLGSRILFDMPKTFKANRAIALNVNASHNIRLTRRLKRVNSYYGLVRAFDLPAEAMADEYIKVFGQRPCCDQASLIRRWKKHFYKGAGGGVDLHRRDQLQEAVQWTANRPESASSIARPPTSSFFWTEDQLGLRDIHIAPTSRSKCFICSREIARNYLRGSWAYHCRKPHRYIHGSCIPRVDGQRGQRALQIIETILADANHDIRRDIAPRLAEIHDKMQRQGI